MTTPRSQEISVRADPKEIGARVRRITWIGLIGNLLLAAVKFVVGTIGHSQAVVADAVHSVSDSATDVAILVGVRYWSAPADECHPYGHRRIETMVSMAIGGVLALVAVGIGFEAIQELKSGVFRPPRWIAFVGAALSIVVKEWLYRWTFATGKRLRSPALVANAWHHRSDVLSSIPAALAVLAGAWKPEWALVDKVGALVVTIFILHAAWTIIKPALDELSDRGAPRETRRRIRELGMSLSDVRSIHAIRTRRMGSGFFVDLHATVDADMTVARGHDISEEVRKVLLDDLPDVLDVVVHLEPDDHESTGEV